MVVKVNAKPSKNMCGCKVRGEPKPQVEIVKQPIGKPGVDVSMIDQTTKNLVVVVVDLLLCG